MSLPKFFKDASGFCYAASERLAENPDLTPWDGGVDETGFAVDADAAPKRRTRKRPAPATEPVVEPTEPTEPVVSSEGA